jgi:anti-sigma B factor antagonist
MGYCWRLRRRLTSCPDGEEKMIIKTYAIDGVTVLALAGQLNGRTSTAVQEQILACLRPRAHLLLDMSQVSYMSSAGLRVMLVLERRVAAMGGQIVLVGLMEEVREVMAITGFLSFFESRESIADGLATLQAKGPSSDGVIDAAN